MHLYITFEIMQDKKLSNFIWFKAEWESRENKDQQMLL